MFAASHAILGTGFDFKLVIGSGSLHYVVAALPEHSEVMKGNLARGCG